MKKKAKYKKHRLSHYDYSSDGIYHVVGNTLNRIKIFGKITDDDDKIELSEAGKILEEEWYKTEIIRKEVTLGEFKIMPDHFHGIITIGKPNLPQCIDQQLRYLYTPYTENFKTAFGPQKRTLGRIVGSIKSVCTTRIKYSIDKNFDWQVSYHDEVIRDMVQLERTNIYVRNNIIDWKKENGWKNSI